MGLLEKAQVNCWSESSTHQHPLPGDLIHYSWAEWDFFVSSYSRLTQGLALPQSLAIHWVTCCLARIPIPFICTSALTFMACLTPLHPQSIVCSGIIEPEACSAHAANSSPNVSPIDNALAAECHTLHHLLSDIYDPLTSATRWWSHVHPVVRPFS